MDLGCFGVNVYDAKIDRGHGFVKCGRDKSAGQYLRIMIACGINDLETEPMAARAIRVSRIDSHF